jgi:hypothetical protein
MFNLTRWPVEPVTHCQQLTGFSGQRLFPTDWHFRFPIIETNVKILTFASILDVTQPKEPS